MKTTDFDYTLPQEKIGQFPAEPRDHSKLMIVDRSDKSIKNKYFYNITDHLKKGDVLVLNNTKVFPARFIGKKETGGIIEVLLIEETQSNKWVALTTPGIKLGQKIIFGDIVFNAIAHDMNTVILETNVSKSSLLSKLNARGLTPLPPYISLSESEGSLRKKYQTVYATETGSVAAPTAGFHFTKDLLNKIKALGVSIEYVTLHVGLGTFIPVKTKNIEDHHMHSESFEVNKNAINRMVRVKQNGGRVFSVGTTTTRVLETVLNEKGFLNRSILKGKTDIFIYPPYKFKLVDALITNFHLPKSTLLSLVSAFSCYPNTKARFKTFKNSLIGEAYSKAIKENYRFYSFGDAMLII